MIAGILALVVGVLIGVVIVHYLDPYNLRH